MITASTGSRWPVQDIDCIRKMDNTQSVPLIVQNKLKYGSHSFEFTPNREKGSAVNHDASSHFYSMEVGTFRAVQKVTVGDHQGGDQGALVFHRSYTVHSKRQDKTVDAGSQPLWKCLSW